jgi:hypothetical protein
VRLFFCFFETKALKYEGRLAYRAGVTTAVSAPVSGGMFSGASVAFRTGAAHKLEEGAIVNVSPVEFPKKYAFKSGCSLLLLCILPSVMVCVSAWLRKLPLYAGFC